MTGLEGVKVTKDYYVDVPFANNGGFYVKGINNLDWGMRKHLSNIFNLKSGNMVMFAFDRGYFTGLIAGLGRLGLVIPKLIPYVDVLMGTRGALRSYIIPACSKDIAFRSASGSSMLNDDLSHKVLAVDIEGAIRMSADCVVIQIFIGTDGQPSSTENLLRAINPGMKYGIPTMGVVAVGGQMEHTDRFFKLATRIVAEMGTNIIKTYYCENSEEVVAACPIPIIMAGGKKLPEREVLILAYNAINGGTHDVGMERNIFQSAHFLEMAATIGRTVHEGFMDKEACESSEDIIH